MPENSVESWRKYWKRVGENYKDSWEICGIDWIKQQEQEFIKEGIDTLKKDNVSLLDIGVGNDRVLEVLLDQFLSKIFGNHFNHAFCFYSFYFSNHHQKSRS